MAREPDTISLQSLLNRKVVDPAGRSLGRVVDFEAERCGDELCVTHLLVGRGAWRSRFAWGGGPAGRRIPWEEIERFSPAIQVRREGREG